MKVLAIDAACSACSSALWSQGLIVASRFAPMERGQAEALMPMIVSVIKDGGCNFNGLDLIAVTVGPGSFTGLRTGLAAARGIAAARDLPVLGVTTLEAVALAAHRQAPKGGDGLPVTVVLETRRADLYIQQFGNDLAPLSAPTTILPEDAATALQNEGALLAGDAALRLLALLDHTARDNVVVAEKATVPDAVYVAEIAAARFSKILPGVAVEPAAPLYLRLPEATQPVAGGRLRP